MAAAATRIPKNTHSLHKISIRTRIARFAKTNVHRRRKAHKSFKFIDEFIPEAKHYLTKEHMDRLLKMTEVEDPIPPQLPKQQPMKLLEEPIPEHIEYQQSFPEFSILCPSQPRFVELVEYFHSFKIP